MLATRMFRSKISSFRKLKSSNNWEIILLYSHLSMIQLTTFFVVGEFQGNPRAKSA